MRLKTFAAGTVELKAGSTFTLTTREVTGDESICSVTYADLPGDVKPGGTILLDDGLVALDGAGGPPTPTSAAGWRTTAS